MLNTVSIMGRLTDTPKLRVTPNDIPVLNFSVAVERSYAKDNERVTDFFNVVAWRSTAKFIAQYFEKGQMIAIRGSLQTSKYVDTDGINRQKVEIVAEEAHFAGDKKTRNELSKNPAGNEPDSEEAE